MAEDRSVSGTGAGPTRTVGRTAGESAALEHFRTLAEAIAHLEGSARTIDRWGRQLADVLIGGGRLLSCGNGGSAAEAQHLTAELVGRFETERQPLSAIALHADTSSVTAIVNDYGIDEMFARQVRAHGRGGDILICLSTSGRSENVLAAAKAAQGIKMTTWGLTGPDPNPLAAVCDSAIAVDARSVSTVQEIHLVLIHAICAAVDLSLGAGR